MSQQDTSAHPNPFEQRSKVRICQVRSLGSPMSGHQPYGALAVEALDFGRLTAALAAAGPLAPTITHFAHEADLGIEGPRIGALTVDWMRLHLQTPSAGLVDVRVLALDGASVESTIDLLEDLRDEAVAREPTPLSYPDVPGYDEQPVSTRAFHQLTFMPDGGPEVEPSWEDVQRLIYRADLEAIEEQSSISNPVEMNRRPGQLAAVGSLGTVAWGIQDYVEVSLALSAAMTVAALDMIQTVRMQSMSVWQEVQALAGPADGAGAEAVRGALSELQRQLAWQQAALAFGVLPSSVMSPLFQSVRVESYHQALYEAADVLAQSKRVSQTLDRLEGVLAAEESRRRS